MDNSETVAYELSDVDEIAATESDEPKIPDDSEHTVHFSQTKEFEIGEDYDYLRRGFFKTVGYYAIRIFAIAVLSVFNFVVFGLKIRGRRNIRKVGKSGAIITPNHVHEMDCTFVNLAFPKRRMYYATLETNFKIPTARHLIRWLGGVPIPAGTSDLKRCIAQAEYALSLGSNICIYPEGVLRPYCDGIRTLRSGAFRLSARSGCPIIPVAITFRERKGLFRLFKRKPCISVTVLEPIFPDENEPSFRKKTEKLKERTRAALTAASLNNINRKEQKNEY